MSIIELDKFNINKFWEKTPTPLKYILIFVIFIAIAYFVFSKKMNDSRLDELDQMKIGISATYELIDNFDNFRKEQDAYNKEVITYLKNLHTLVQELNESTNRKFDMLLKSGNKNSNQIIDKILLLNESFDKISKVYKESIKTPNTQSQEPKVIIAVPIDDWNLNRNQKRK